MQSLTEKRVFAPDRPARTVYIGTERGLVALSVAGSSLGRFSLATRGAVHALTATPQGVVAAVDDRLIAVAGAELPPSVPATTGAVDVVGADAAGVWTAVGTAVTRYPLGTAAAPETHRTGAPVTAIAPPFIGTTDGLLRHGAAGLQAVGLEHVTGLTATPLVGTTAGLYTLGNGWMRRVDAPVTAVASGEQQHAAVIEEAVVTATDGWTTTAAPPVPPVDVAVTADAVYAIGADGVAMAHTPGAPWTQTHLGVGGITGIAVAPTTNGKHPARAAPT
jgi:hypothetical protein